MTHSTYADSLTLATTALRQAKHLLTIAEKYAADNGKSESEILGLALAPDMFPFTRQIQSISDNTKGLASRIGGVTAPSMPDTETTFAELQARLDKTLEFVTSVKPMDSDAIDALEITFPWVPGKAIKGHDCVLLMGVPNIFFHLSMAYANLRVIGVPVGKTDYLGNLPFYDKA